MTTVLDTWAPSADAVPEPAPQPDPWHPAEPVPPYPPQPETFTVDIPDMVDCRQRATVCLGDAFACETHRWELVAADKGVNIVLHLSGAGHDCGEHLRTEVAR